MERNNVVTFPMSTGETVIVDAIDSDLSVGRCYPTGSKKYPTIRTVAIHRAVLARILGRALERHEEVDHINGDVYDNRRSNLRPASHQQNMRNRKIHRNNTSGYKGVTWHSHRKKWWARIRINGKQTSLGMYATKEAAHEAYCKAAEEHFGEFAPDRALTVREAASE